MIILGIDPGTATTGFGIIEKKNDKIGLIACGCILTSAGLSLDRRLDSVFKDVSKLIEKYKPNALSCEEIFFFKNAKTVISVSHSRGVVLLAGRRAKIPVYEYTPLQVKQALTGYGRADKKQIQEMVKILLGLESVPRPDDAADAVAVAVCHANNQHLDFNNE